MKKIISVLLVVMLLLCSGCKQTKPEEEILVAVNNISKAHALYFEQFIAGNMVGSDKQLPADKNPYPQSVYYAHKEEYDTVKELKELVCTYFSEEVFENNFMSEFESKYEGMPPYLVEVDGVIYTNCNYGVGGSVVFMTETARITEMGNNYATVEIQCYNTMDETSKETTTVDMVYENGKWVFDQAYLLKQYIPESKEQPTEQPVKQTEPVIDDSLLLDANVISEYIIKSIASYTTPDEPEFRYLYFVFLCNYEKEQPDFCYYNPEPVDEYGDLHIDIDCSKKNNTSGFRL